jgi:hypothetical protein
MDIDNTAGTARETPAFLHNSNTRYTTTFDAHFLIYYPLPSREDLSKIKSSVRYRRRLIPPVGRYGTYLERYIAQRNQELLSKIRTYLITSIVVKPVV